MMRISRKTLVAWTIGICLSWLIPTDSPAGATEPTARSSPNELLKELLSKEVDGQVVQRREAVVTRPMDDWSAWQAGYVKVAGKWHGLDALSPEQYDKQYLAQREAVRDQLDFHLAIARWCRANERPQAARAHYLAYLYDHPTDVESHEYVGHVLVNSESMDHQWVDKVELDGARQEFRNQIAAIQQWAPKLKPILEDLRSRNANRTRHALNRLDAIDADAALPALALAAANTENDLALPLVGKISQSRSTEACQTLLQLALEHDGQDVHRQAVKALKLFPLEFFVPQLLSQLSTEATIEYGKAMSSHGVLTKSIVIKQELQDKSVHRTLNQSINLLSSFFVVRRANTQVNDYGPMYIWSIARGISPDNAQPSGGRTAVDSKSVSAYAFAAVNYVAPELAVSASKNADEATLKEKLKIDQANRQLKEKCKPIYALLRETTGETFGDEPNPWWDWWQTKSERQSPSLKPVDKRYEYQRLQVGANVYKNEWENSSINREVPKVLVRMSCLVAGTPVQTSTGLVPVEKIQVGDLVPCQNVETGELSLQAVMRTTVRNPVTTLQIVMPNETIQATGGHLWWVSGKGWTKTRDLTPGMILHSAEGSVAVEAIREVDEPLPTYNLVVDRNHTYFVGQSRILSYDNSPVQPTTKTLPGYVASK